MVVCYCQRRTVAFKSKTNTDDRRMSYRLVILLQCRDRPMKRFFFAENNYDRRPNKITIFNIMTVEKINKSNAKRNQLVVSMY